MGASMKLLNFVIAAYLGVGVGHTKMDAVALTLAFYLMLQAANKIGRDYWGKS